MPIHNAYNKKNKERNRIRKERIKVGATQEFERPKPNLKNEVFI